MSDGTREPTGVCALCGETVPADMLLGHLRGAHELDVEIAEWPDGRPVIVDETLTPDDFRAGSPGEETT